MSAQELTQREVAKFAWLAAYWALMYNACINHYSGGGKAMTVVEAAETVTEAESALDIPTDFSEACPKCNGGETQGRCRACCGVGIVLTNTEDMDIARRHRIK